MHNILQHQVQRLAGTPSCNTSPLFAACARVSQPAAMAALQLKLPSSGRLPPPPPFGGMTWNGARARSGACRSYAWPACGAVQHVIFALHVLLLHNYDMLPLSSKVQYIGNNWLLLHLHLIFFK